LSSDSKPVRVAFCITDLDPGGAERALLELVRRLDHSEWEPSVFCLSKAGALVDQFEAANVPVTCLGATSSLNVTVLPRLIGHLRRQKPQLLQTFLFHANIMGRVAGRLAGVSRIVSGIRVAEKRSRFPLWLDRVTDRFVHRHVCVSGAVARFSMDTGRLPSNKVEVIGNGVDADRFGKAVPADLSKFGIPKGSRVGVFVGRLDPQKQPLLLLEAARTLAVEHGELHFLLVGEGPMRGELEAFIDSHGLSSGVHLAGWQADVPGILAGADFLVLPSLWEGMPNVILEAMAAGLPVVSTRVEGTDELIDDGKNGMIVEPNSPAELVEAISQLLQNPTRTKEMGRLAQQKVTKEFTWDSMVAQYTSLYRQLLGR